MASVQGDAYLKAPNLSFYPYKRYAPYITGRPEVNNRLVNPVADRILTLASDGVWERASGDDVLRWVRNYYNAQIAGMKEQHMQYDNDDGGSMLGVEQQNDPFDDVVRDAAVTGKSLSRRTRGRNMNTDDNDALAISKEDNGTAQDLLTPPVENTSKAHPDDTSADKNVEDSNAATTTANETTAPTHVVTKGAGIKRNHSAVKTSVSSRSASSTTRSSRGQEVEVGGAANSSSRVQNRHHRHHLRSSSSSRTSSLTIPTVSDVIVRKVLNKVQK